MTSKRYLDPFDPRYADSAEHKESLRSMMSRTYEPIRPLAAPDNGAAYYVDAMASIGAPRVDYGLDYWPSRSYWLIPTC